MTNSDPLARLRAVADADEHPEAGFARDLRRRLLDELADAAPVAPVVEPVPLAAPPRTPQRRRGVIGLVLAAAAVLVVALAVALISDDEGAVVTDDPTPVPAPTVEPEPTVDPASEARVDKAGALLDALYAGDRAGLEAAAPEADLGYVTYAMDWLPVVNTEVLSRTCESAGTGVVCFVTVRDDLIEALEIGFDATDEFRFVFADGEIALITTNSDLPFVVQELYTWVLITDPVAYERACDGFFAGGPTPADCARLMLDSVPDFKLTDAYLEFISDGG